MYDNTKLIKNKLLNFSNSDIYYVIEIIARKKDAILDNDVDVYKHAYGNDDEKLISRFIIKNMKDYDDYVKISRQMVKNLIYTRAYISVNPKSVKRSLSHTIDYLNNLTKSCIKGGDNSIVKKVFNIPDIIMSGKSSSNTNIPKYALLEIDFSIKDNESKNKKDISKKEATFNQTKIINSYNHVIKKLKEIDADFFTYPSPNGFHIFINKFTHTLITNKYPQTWYLEPQTWYLEFLDKPYVNGKLDSPALLLAY